MEGKSPRTVQGYRETLARFQRCLQEDAAPLDPDRLRPDHVIAYLARCADARAAYGADRGPAPGPLFVAARYSRLHPSVRLRPNGLKQLLRRLGRAAGVPRVHAHRFRHTFATWAIAHDARELDVQHPSGGGANVVGR